MSLRLVVSFHCLMAQVIYDGYKLQSNQDLYPFTEKLCVQSKCFLGGLAVQCRILSHTVSFIIISFSSKCVCSAVKLNTNFQIL